MKYHRAYAVASRELIFQHVPACPPDMCESCHLNKHKTDLHSGLRLPDNCTILDVSAHVRFMTAQVVIRMECPDFPETAEGEPMPEIEPVYGAVELTPGKMQDDHSYILGNIAGYFTCWSPASGSPFESTCPRTKAVKAAVETAVMNGPDRESLKLIFGDSGSWRNREPLL